MGRRRKQQPLKMYLDNDGEWDYDAEICAKLRHYPSYVAHVRDSHIMNRLTAKRARKALDRAERARAFVMQWS